MKRYLKITTVVAGAHFVLCSAILVWFFRIINHVEGDPLFLHLLNKVLLVVRPNGDIYHGKWPVIAIFALNSVIWGAGTGLLIYAITSKFQKRTA